MSDYKKMQLILCGLLIVNFISVIFHAGNMVTGMVYVIENNLSREFLLKAGVLPYNSWHILFCVMILFILLVLDLIFIHQEKHPLLRFLGAVLIALGITLNLNGGYTGLFLMLICFFMPREGTWEKGWHYILCCIVLYVGCQYSFLSVLCHIPNPSAFIQVFPAAIQSVLNILFTILQSLNVFMFIAFITIYLNDQYQKNESIERELEMVSAVNVELKNYAAITEKIGEDKERKRLAREIHDTLGHALTGIAAGIDACIALSDRNPQAVKKQLEVVSRVVRQGIVDVRNSLNKLRPGALETDSFRQALDKMIQEFMDVSSLKINFDYRLQDYDFGITKEDSLFRIIQESITNALRHGHASEIWISMYSDNNCVILSIRDNGMGCEEIHVGYGLRQMQERVNMMGGKVFFDGSQGFMTIVNLPVQQGELRSNTDF